MQNDAAISHGPGIVLPGGRHRPQRCRHGTGDALPACLVVPGEDGAPGAHGPGSAPQVAAVAAHVAHLGRAGPIAHLVDLDVGVQLHAVVVGEGEMRRRHQVAGGVGDAVHLQGVGVAVAEGCGEAQEDFVSHIGSSGAAAEALHPVEHPCVHGRAGRGVCRVGATAQRVVLQRTDAGWVVALADGQAQHGVRFDVEGRDGGRRDIAQGNVVHEVGAALGILVPAQPLDVVQVPVHGGERRGGNAHPPPCVVYDAALDVVADVYHVAVVVPCADRKGRVARVGRWAAEVEFDHVVWGEITAFTAAAVKIVGRTMPWVGGQFQGVAAPATFARDLMQIENAGIVVSQQRGGAGLAVVEDDVAGGSGFRSSADAPEVQEQQGERAQGKSDQEFSSAPVHRDRFPCSLTSPAAG